MEVSTLDRSKNLSFTSRWIGVFLIAMSLLFIPALTAQPLEFVVEEFNAQNGLPEIWIWDMEQDDQGFLWFSTSEGLIRYDGYEFVSYRQDLSDPYSLRGRFADQVFLDDAGILWVHTRDGGLSRFDAEQETFKLIIPTQHARFINGLIADEDGTSWVGTEGGLVSIGPEGNVTGRFFPVPEDSLHIEKNAVKPLWFFDDGDLLVKLFAGLFKFDPQAEVFIAVASDSLLHNDYIVDIEEESSRSIWMGTWRNGLVQYDRQQNRVLEKIPLNRAGPGPAISELLIDKQERLWIRSEHDLYLFDREKNEFDEVQLRIAGTDRLFERGPLCMFEDRSGVIWICSQHGLARIVPSLTRFSYTQHEPGNENSLLPGFVSTIDEASDGTLWMSVPRSGLSRSDRNTGTYSHFLQDRSRTNGKGLVIPVEIDREDNVWVGFYHENGGLIRIDPRTDEVTRFQHDPSDVTSLSHNEVNVIFEGSAGDLWVATYADSGGGLNHFDKEKETFRRYSHVPGDSTSLCDNRIISLDENSARSLWVGTQTCLSKFDKTTQRFTNYSDFYQVRDVLEDRSGRLWVGDAGGIHLFDHKDATIRTYTAEDGLAHKGAGAILEDDAGYLWISTLNGLSKFDPVTERFTVYRTENGLPENRFVEGSGFKSSEGELFFGMEEGLLSFFPDEITDNQYPPDVVVTEFNLAGERVQHGSDSPLIKPVWLADHITLSHDQNVFSFEAAALHFGYPERNQYAFKLENHDKDWIYVGETRTAFYANVVPGEYIFRVKAANADGVWNEEGSAIAITILPPWWRTTWAYIGYGLLFIAGLVTADRIQRRRVIAKERQQAQIREAKLEAEAAQALSREATAMNRALEEENRRKEVEIEKAEELRQAHAALETSYEDLQQTHTRLQETQEQLIHAEKMASLGQLTAGIAHEIKNPLNFVNNFSQLSLGMMEELQHFLQQLHGLPHGRTPVSALLNPEQPASEEGAQADHNRTPERLGTGSAPHGAAENDGSALMWEEALETIELLMMNAEKIAHHGQRADGIVRAMIEHSRTGPGERRPVDLNQLLEEHVQLAYHGMQARNGEFAVELVCDYDEAIGEVEVVPQELGRVFINLLNNAFDAVKERAENEADHVPRVHIKTVHREDGIEVRIEDNGVGIPDLVRDKVFLPFFTTKPAGSGSTGLGLSLSHDIVVKGHGGELKVESEEGVGATFVIRVPNAE